MSSAKPTVTDRRDEFAAKIRLHLSGVLRRRFPLLLVKI